MRIGPKPKPIRTRVQIQDISESAQQVVTFTIYQDPKIVARVIERALREAFEKPKP